MGKLYRYLSILAALALGLSGCRAHIALAKQTDSKADTYKDILGRPLNDKVVDEFIASNHCSSSMPYFLCKEAGVALMIDANQIVEGVFLYLNKSAGSVPYEEDFAAYKGELPFGLKFYDTMEAVEYKLKRQGIGNAGLPDTDGTPDHMHYVATYKKAGLSIIYNSPVDEAAMIYAILIRK